jgi:hypothetical protein
MSAMSDVLRHGAHSFPQSTLSFRKHSHQLGWRGWLWWGKVLVVIVVLATTTSPT